MTSGLFAGGPGRPRDMNSSASQSDQDCEKTSSTWSSRISCSRSWNTGTTTMLLHALRFAMRMLPCFSFANSGFPSSSMRSNLFSSASVSFGSSGNPKTWLSVCTRYRVVWRSCRTAPAVAAPRMVLRSASRIMSAMKSSMTRSNQSERSAAMVVTMRMLRCATVGTGWCRQFRTRTCCSSAQRRRPRRSIIHSTVVRESSTRYRKKHRSSVVRLWMSPRSAMARKSVSSGSQLTTWSTMLCVISASCFDCSVLRASGVWKMDASALPASFFARLSPLAARQYPSGISGSGSRSVSSRASWPLRYSN